MTPDTLVVGLGSIGQRHVRVLRDMGRSVATVSRRGDGDYASLGQALENIRFDYIVIATETSTHAQAVADLAQAGFAGAVLIEKPLCGHPTPLPATSFRTFALGYNLRFHPVLQRAADILARGPALSAAAYVGQFLPDWRPGRDYRTTASATRIAGGGVLRDLSHELDYLLWLFGPWRRLAAISQRTGELGIDVDDIAAVLMECECCPAVTLHLNYYHRPVARSLTVNTAARTIVADFVAGTVSVDGVPEQFAVTRDQTYRAMHAAVLAGAAGPCLVGEGAAVDGLIDAIERAAVAGQWVSA